MCSAAPSTTGLVSDRHSDLLTSRPIQQTLQRLGQRGDQKCLAWHCVNLVTMFGPSRKMRVRLWPRTLWYPLSSLHFPVARGCQCDTTGSAIGHVYAGVLWNSKGNLSRCYAYPILLCSSQHLVSTFCCCWFVIFIFMLVILVICLCKIK